MGIAVLNRMVRVEFIEQVVSEQRLESPIPFEFGYNAAPRGRGAVWWRQVRHTGAGSLWT